MFHNKEKRMVRQYLYCSFFLFLFFTIINRNDLFSQTKPDSTTAIDSSKKNLPAHPQIASTSDTAKKISAPEKTHSVISMEFVKEKSQQNTDSLFFNILKISNNNGKPVQGVVKISIPEGWKIVSQEETTVTIQPGTSEYIPVRVSLSRNAVGGVTYLINATLSSDRVLFPNKNQTSVSKACYITIIKKGKWSIDAVQRTVYFNRYTEYTPLLLQVSNKGNGNEVIKIELELGSAIEMHGSLGKKYLTSVELKPHSDSIISFPLKFIPPDESVYWNRDFRSLVVKINATASDTVIKSTSVNFKYLENNYNNVLAEQVYPLNIEAQMQNLLSDYAPRIFFGADGYIFLKDNTTLDYYFRLNNVALTGYKDAADFSEQVFWRYSRFRAHYDAGRWQLSVGDIALPGISMLGLAGRGIGGSYIINKKNKISGALTTDVYRALYSGNLQHETVLPKHITLVSGLSFIENDYNKMNTFGASVKATYPFYPGHRISVLVGASETRHLYDNQTFTDINGNFIKTTNPSATFYGFGTKVDYTMSLKKIKTSLSANYISKNYSQYFNGRLWIQGTSQYTINKKYYILGQVNFNQQDPQIYNRGILNPENKFTYGRYNLEFADKINARLILSTGPIIETSDQRMLKIQSINGDSVHTRFSAISPKWLIRLHLKNSSYSSLSVFSTMGYTYITHAEDPTLPSLPFNASVPFFTSNTGVNILQKNGGVNITYYTGPYNIFMQSDYYYGQFNKTIRIMPFFQRYFYNRKLLVTSYNSYFYQTNSNIQSIALNARFNYILDKGWTLYLDNNLYTNSRISSDGIKTYSQMYGLNIGFRKSFDIPQPAVKYYNLKIICFKDINGNGIMDANEHGLTDIVITIDRQEKIDSITHKPLKMREQFSPAELVTDDFGEITYNHIPQGEFNINVFPLTNLKDVFNVKGQKQNLSISHDTTYYVPFVQSYRVLGHIILKRDEYSSLGNISLANIRITATDSLGNSYMALTSGDGSYVLYAPQAGEYKLSITNVFGEQFTLQESEYKVIFNGAKEFQVDFIFNEKKRHINISGNSSSPTGSTNISTPPTVNPVPTQSAVPTHPVNTPSANPPKSDTTSSVNPKPLPPGASAGVTYRIQIVSSKKQIPKSQWNKTFKGLRDVQEYIDNGVYKYSAGNFSTFDFDKATDYKDSLIAQGYKDAFVAFFKAGKRIK